MSLSLCTIFLATAIFSVSAQYYDDSNESDTGWRGPYSVGLVIGVAVAIMLLLCCCVSVAGRGRKSTRPKVPAVKPPAGGGLPCYSMYGLPNNNKPAQDQNQQEQNIGGYQRYDAEPPPPYGKAACASKTDNYPLPPGPPPQAYIAGETNHFVGGFREQH